MGEVLVGFGVLVALALGFRAISRQVKQVDRTVTNWAGSPDNLREQLDIERRSNALYWLIATLLQMHREDKPYPRLDLTGQALKQPVPSFSMMTEPQSDGLVHRLEVELHPDALRFTATPLLAELLRRDVPDQFSRVNFALKGLGAPAVVVANQSMARTPAPA
jgi:hypothetical protein